MVTLPPIRRIDRSKIDDYLLHPTKSRGKAAFFQACGFARERGHELHDALLDQAASGAVLDVVVSPYGNRYIVRGELHTPSGRVPPPVIDTVWQADTGVDGVRLITAYPT